MKMPLALVTENLALDFEGAPEVPHDHITEAMERVSRESGVPVEDFAYKYDASEGPMSELNRRAYAYAAAAAGVRVLPAFRIAGIHSEPYFKPRRALADRTAATLRIVHSTIRSLTVATEQEIAQQAMLKRSTVKGRIRRLSDAGLIRLVQRERGEYGPYLWTVTEAEFDDVFVVVSDSIASQHAEAA